LVDSDLRDEICSFFKGFHTCRILEIIMILVNSFKLE
jgi:hypothetical protein